MFGEDVLRLIEQARDDDGAALRLAVRLSMNVDVCEGSVSVLGIRVPQCVETFGDDPMVAVRKAICRAAMEIEKTHWVQRS